MRRSDTPFSLSAVLAQSPALRDRQRLAWSTWRAIVGHRVANHTMPLRIEGDTLYVAVSSALWASELSLLQTPILAKLRDVLPKVHLLRFRVGPVKPPLDAAPPVRVHRAELPEELTESLERVTDPELRAVIGEAARYSLGRANVNSERSSQAPTSSREKTRNEPF